jgi:phage terminase large subunit-like protein
VSSELRLRLIAFSKEAERRIKTRKLLSFYPDSGPLRRELYTKHMEFFAAGTTHLARAAIAANRVGKTTLSAFETTLHLTGKYPNWWPGRRFAHPVDWWAASDTGETTRDISQLEFLGKIGEFGTGMIPKDCIQGEPSHRRGVSDAIDTVRVKHVSGGTSTLAFKSYDQGREKFQGTKKHGISLDEEPPVDVYTECLTRLMATAPGDSDGSMICTFTPLKGMSVVVLMFLNEPSPDRFVLTMGFNDAPHLSEESKAKLLAAFPPHERDARSKGIPRLGSGAIYPIIEDEIIVPDFAIPDHWPRGYSLDVGWNRTAALWGALNRDTDTLYLYSEHYRGQAEPSIHAEAVRARGKWIPGVIDPASRGRSQVDGTQLVTLYKDLGLNLEFAQNAVESGIYEVWQRMSTGRLKVFQSLGSLRGELRLYRRDEKGRIIKENDHLADCLRYLTNPESLRRFKTKPIEQSDRPQTEYGSFGGGSGWMG